MTSTITSFLKRQPAEIEYWVHIEQVATDDNTASLGEVAELVDEIYGTDPCLKEGETLEETPDPATEEPPEEETEDPPPPITEEDFADLIKEFDLNLCGVTFNGDCTVQVKVAISHPGDNYTLRVSNGEIGGTVTVYGELVSETIVIDNASSIELDFPVVSGATFEWYGSVYGSAGNMTGPQITLSGRTLSWDEEVTGSISMSYYTQYDLIDITIFGNEDGEPAECRAICFYHGLIDEIDLQPPEIEDNEGLEIYRQPFCGAIETDPPEDNDDIQCYENVTKVYRCECSDSKAYDITEEVVTACPEGIRCPNGDEKCRALLGSRTILGGYIDCSEGGSLSDPAYRKEICCDAASGLLPTCQTQYSVNPGGVPIDPTALEQYRMLYHDSLRVIAVKPSDGDCGVVKRQIVVSAKNCCDEVPPLEIDATESVTILADNSSGIIRTTNPTSGNVTVEVHGNGFYARPDLHAKTASYNGGDGFLIYTSNACGTGEIEISDGCSTVKHRVASTDGQWGPMIGEWTTGHEIAVTGLEGTQDYEDAGVYRWIGQNSVFKQYETWGGTIACGSGTCSSFCSSICGVDSLCPISNIGSYAHYPCYALHSVFSNREYHTVDTDGCSSGMKSCSCTCISGHSYQEWIC